MKAVQQITNECERLKSVKQKLHGQLERLGEDPVIRHTTVKLIDKIQVQIDVLNWCKT